MKGKLATWMAASLVGLGLAGCGPKPPTPKPLTLTVQMESFSRTALIPFRVAQSLGFFSEQKMVVQVSNGPSADVTIGRWAGRGSIIGYLAVRPDLVLISEAPDPWFRLRALNQLPLMASTQAAQQERWADTVFRDHHAQIARWQVASWTEVKRLWQAHRLPWVLVTLSQSVELQPAHVLAWLGASTGAVPAVVIRTDQPRSALMARFLDALNLALWYVKTTPAPRLAAAINHDRPDPTLAAIIHQGQRYQYWPATTFPDQSTYERGSLLEMSRWPPYDRAVDPTPATRALSAASKT